MQTRKKTITIVSVIISLIAAGVAVIFSLLFLNQGNDARAVPNVNPVVETRTYYVEDGLPSISLLDGDTAGKISWVGGQEIVEGVKEYKWKYIPVKVKVYQEIEGSIELTFVHKETIIKEANPITSQLTYGLNLSNSIFTGGRVVAESDTNTNITGKWSWVDKYHIPSASDKNQYFDAIFTPDNEKYSPKTFQIPVMVNKRDLIISPTYGLYKGLNEEDPEITYQVLGIPIGETPIFTGSLSRQEGEMIGSYTYSLGSLQIKDNPEGNFDTNNYNLVLSDNTNEDNVFRIYYPLELADVKIGNVNLKENENVVLKEYDGRSITHATYLCSMTDFSNYVRYGKVNNKNTWSSTTHDVIDPGDYYVEIEITPRNNEEGLFIES